MTWVVQPTGLLGQAGQAQTIHILMELIYVSRLSRDATKLCLTIFHIMANPLIQRVHIPHELALLFQAAARADVQIGLELALVRR